MTVLVMLMQSVHGILVAMTIKKCGIVFRLILGTVSICLCIIIEGVIFLEPVVFREVLCIIMVIVGSNMYSAARPATAAVFPMVSPLPDEALEKEKQLVARGGIPEHHSHRGTRRRCSPTPCEVGPVSSSASSSKSIFANITG